MLVWIDMVVLHVNARFERKLSHTHIDDCWATEFLKVNKKRRNGEPSAWWDARVGHAMVERGESWFSPPTSANNRNVRDDNKLWGLDGQLAWDVNHDLSTKRKSEDIDCLENMKSSGR
jgi:hypothetical protein